MLCPECGLPPEQCTCDQVGQQATGVLAELGGVLQLGDDFDPENPPDLDQEE